MTLNDCLVNGGIPSGANTEGLRWLAQAHRHQAKYVSYPRGSGRAQWHLRWAATIEEILESRNGHTRV